MKKYCFVIVLWLFVSSTLAQQTAVYTNFTYNPQIKSVQCYNTAKEGAFPVIKLNSGEQIMLSFDDLSGQSRTYYYTLEHCNAQWNSSRLSPTEYLQGYTEDRIMDYQYSSGTFQKYVHYEVKLPNQNIAPKLPGNYLLKVYRDGNQEQLIITRRIYVLNPAVGISAEVVPSAIVLRRQTHQKVNFQVNYGGLTVQNPYSDIKVCVMQNARPETAQLNTRPTFIRGSQLIYNDVNQNDFAGGNEFRHFDIRTLKLNSDRVARIFKDTANTVLLLADERRNTPSYLFQYDNNGRFYIINQDGRDARTDADYAFVYFSLAATPPSNGSDIYLVGQFNNYHIGAENKMTFDSSHNKYYLNMLLKQGVYDYQYVQTGPGGTVTGMPLEGSYFETENEYQVLVYYRGPASRWDELVGYQLITQAKR